MHFTKSVIFTFCARAGDVKKSGLCHCAFFQKWRGRAAGKTGDFSLLKKPSESSKGDEPSRLFKRIRRRARGGAGRFLRRENLISRAKSVSSQFLRPKIRKIFSKNRPGRQRRGGCSPLRRLIEAFLGQQKSRRKKRRPFFMALSEITSRQRTRPAERSARPARPARRRRPERRNTPAGLPRP